jgi:hypothetical protein
METVAFHFTEPNVSFTVPEKLSPTTCASAGKLRKRLKATTVNVGRPKALVVGTMRKFMRESSGIIAVQH